MFRVLRQLQTGPWFTREFGRQDRQIHPNRRHEFHKNEPDNEKTGALFAVASQLGARISNASEEIQTNLKEFGLKIGTAYQIYDDCIDLVGEETNTGKTLGTDLEKGKLTLPLLNLISSGTASQKEKLNQRILLKEPIDINVLAGIADYDGAIERALDTGKALLQESRELLTPLENTSYKTGLVEITNYLEKLFSDCI